MKNANLILQTSFIYQFALVAIVYLNLQIH